MCVVCHSNDPEELEKKKAQMVSLVVNKGVLVVLSMSVVNMFNSTQGRGDGGGDEGGPALDCDWLSRVASHQIISLITEKNIWPNEKNPDWNDSNATSSNNKLV